MFTKSSWKLSNKRVGIVLKNLYRWIQDSKQTPPAVILNKHCIYCCFQKDCEAKAVEKDDLSLLGMMTPKVIQKYQKKGIFTINQLSYLYRPRKGIHFIENSYDTLDASYNFLGIWIEFKGSDINGITAIKQIRSNME